MSDVSAVFADAGAADVGDRAAADSRPVLDGRLVGEVERVAHLIAGCGGDVVFFTGAGVSVGAGLGTYRGAGGLWTLRPDLVELLSSGVRSDRFHLLWDHVDGVASASGFALAHRAVVDLARVLGAAGRAVSVVTQNIDGLHEAAAVAFGVDVPVFALHGSVARARCGRPRCGWRGFRDGLVVDGAGCPRCPLCHARVRPDVVLFGEELDADTWAAAESVSVRCRVMVVAGTSLEVWPASRLPGIAAGRGADVVWANVDPAPSSVWLPLVGPNDVVLPALVARVADLLGR